MAFLLETNLDLRRFKHYGSKSHARASVCSLCDLELNGITIIMIIQLNLLLNMATVNAQGYLNRQTIQ